MIINFATKSKAWQKTPSHLATLTEDLLGDTRQYISSSPVVSLSSDRYKLQRYARTQTTLPSSHLQNRHSALIRYTDNRDNFNMCLFFSPHWQYVVVFVCYSCNQTQYLTLVNDRVVNIHSDIFTVIQTCRNC